ncbi:MAG: hypothetical protein JO057_23500, partial [Chloroflexi bacterium]|nr:hypothetical protein [Chloroflexota bacterium]
MPDIPIGVETWGTGALSAPLHARLSEYERAFELPLWNPYQGLGEPYAAQGDGSPYSPFELLRALLPYSLGNYVTVLAYYLSAVCLFLFLRDLGLTEGAAIVGGIGWMLSGALSLHVARPEFGDQLAMLPVLLWAAQRALRLRTLRAYVLFAVASGISALAGHIQIAMIASVLVIAFIICSARLLTSGPVAWFRQMSLMLGVFVLGNGLAAFYLLPLAEALRISSNRNGTLLSYIEMPYANIVAFFYPLVFGHLFQSWIGGTFPDVVDWNNLYAYAGTWPLVLVVVGLVCVRNRGQQQFWFFFFCVTALILLLRFVSFPLIAGFDMVPIFGRQSPKHSQGVAVLCLTIAAAIAVDHLRNREDRRVRWAILVAAIATLSTILTMIAQHGTPATLDWQVANIYIPTTLLVCAVVVLMVWLARRGKRLPPESAPILIGGVVVAEASMYIPLGNGGSDFLLGRLAVFGLIVVGSCGLALHARWLAGGAFAVALAGYASLIVLPAVGLPSQFDVDSPPPYMQWLRATGGDQFRTFGIAPDWSSIDRVQDISAVGPLAPQDYSQFIKLASSQAMFNYYVSSSNFLLLNDDPSFNLVGDYDRNKAVFDWFGVKYLVIDHANFNPEARTDDQALLAVEPDVQVAYDDGRITILA